MSVLRRIDAIRVVAAVMMLALGSMPATAQSVAGTAQARAHVYLLRGLMNIFSLGMDSLAEELSKRGVYATVSNHSEWQSLADQAASNYKARKEDPIILVGHSLGADAVMQMAAYLNRKKIPVAAKCGAGSPAAIKVSPAPVSYFVCTAPGVAATLSMANTSVGMIFMRASPKNLL